MDKIHILVVDDEVGIRDIIREYMEAEAYMVIEAVDGVDGMNKFKQNTIDLVILDVMMPKLDGWKVCREIRKISEVPIIMLTARGEEYDKLFGFEMGVDDYVVKPFSPRELLARVNAILTRRKPPRTKENADVLIYGGIRLDIEGRSLHVDHKAVITTPKEFELLLYLLQNPYKAFSREQLLSSVWGYDYFGDNRTIDTHIKMLREHLGPYREWIETVWSVGYKFEPEDRK